MRAPAQGGYMSIFSSFLLISVPIFKFKMWFQIILKSKLSLHSIT
jgi:hypothetical protein